jgi:hypothetical protein
VTSVTSWGNPAAASTTASGNAIVAPYRRISAIAARLGA